jgi:integrase
VFLSKRSHGVYYLYYLDDLGKRHKISTHCERKSDALKFIQQFRLSEEQKKAKLQRVLLSQFAESFLSHSRNVHRPKTQESIRTSFRESQRVVGDLPLHKIGVREVEKFVVTKKSTRSERTARVYFVTLRSAFETARRWKHIATNPFSQVEIPGIVEIQLTFFTREEFLCLLQVLDDPDLRDLYLIALATGMRVGELTSLTWSNVDLGRGLIYLRNSETFTTKTKKNCAVPMSRDVLRLFSERKVRATCDLVFHLDGRRMRKEYVTKRFKKYVLKAGLNPKLHFHSIRHYAESRTMPSSA